MSQYFFSPTLLAATAKNFSDLADFPPMFLQKTVGAPFLMEKVNGIRSLGLVESMKPDFLERTAEFFEGDKNDK